MYYVIANSPNTDAFFLDIQILRLTNAPFTVEYISSFTNPVVPGEWGCARFAYPAPSGKIFHTPCVEYRLSNETGKWQVDGVDSPISEFVDGLHRYFVSLEGKDQ